MAKRRKKIDVEKAVDRSEEFHGFVPRRIKSITIDWPGSLVHLGRCAQVDYISGKFDGEVRRYFHEFGEGVQLFASQGPMRSGKEMLVIIGNFKITEDGIVG